MTRQLRSADSLLCPAVKETIIALKLGKEDTAVSRLAIRYAEMIDDEPALIFDLGPKLLSTLDAMCATPKARAGRHATASREQARLQAIRDARAS